jgi:hypothetical protein
MNQRNSQQNSEKKLVHFYRYSYKYSVAFLSFIETQKTCGKGIFAGIGRKKNQ